jgi:hypothetical protein
VLPIPDQVDPDALSAEEKQLHTMVKQMRRLELSAQAASGSKADNLNWLFEGMAVQSMPLLARLPVNRHNRAVIEAAVNADLTIKRCTEAMGIWDKISRDAEDQRWNATVSRPASTQSNACSGSAQLADAWLSSVFYSLTVISAAGCDGWYQRCRARVGSMVSDWESVNQHSWQQLAWLLFPAAYSRLFLFCVLVGDREKVEQDFQSSAAAQLKEQQDMDAELQKVQAEADLKRNAVSCSELDCSIAGLQLELIGYEEVTRPDLQVELEKAKTHQQTIAAAAAEAAPLAQDTAAPAAGVIAPAIAAEVARLASVAVAAELTRLAPVAVAAEARAHGQQQHKRTAQASGDHSLREQEANSSKKARRQFGSSQRPSFPSHKRSASAASSYGSVFSHDGHDSSKSARSSFDKTSASSAAANQPH